MQLSRCLAAFVAGSEFELQPNPTVGNPMDFGVWVVNLAQDPTECRGKTQTVAQRRLRSAEGRWGWGWGLIQTFCLEISLLHVTNEIRLFDD